MGQEESEVVVLYKKPLMDMFEAIRSLSSLEWTDKALSELHESVIYRSGTCYEFAASDDEDKQQLQSFYEACKGIPPDLNRRGVHESEPAESNPENTYVVPSAPPIPIIDEGKVEYRPIESHVNFSAPYMGNEKAGTSSQGKDEDVPSSCVTCLETLVEGACVPCGHMAGCVACLDEINTKNRVCPVCGTKINQVIKIYAV